MTVELVQYRITIRGRVQGVGFRWSALTEARALGITGFVKNQSDGSVYIEAEGTKEQLRILADWCRKGPGRGHVENIYVSEYPSQGYTGFEIRH